MVSDVFAVQGAVLLHQRSDGEERAAAGRGRARRRVPHTGLRLGRGRPHTGALPDNTEISYYL